MSSLAIVLKQQFAHVACCSQFLREEGSGARCPRTYKYVQNIRRHVDLNLPKAILSSNQQYTTSTSDPGVVAYSFSSLFDLNVIDAVPTR
jgi:hypothetical protein